MATQIVVEDSHFAYLKIQRGSIWRMTGERQVWQKAYEESLQRQFDSIKPYLPETCNQIVDVGSGLGGIDILLSRHYGGCPVCLIDGEDDPPTMELHRKTFSNFQVAKDFLAKNGVKDVSTTMVRETDLVVSFGAWCFHFPPLLYLPTVAPCSEFATIILEVRKDKPKWDAQLAAVFGEPIVIHSSLKFERRVYGL